MEERKYTLGVVIDNRGFRSEAEQKVFYEAIKKKYNLSDEKMKNLSKACLFKLSDNIRYKTFGTDLGLWDKDNGAFYLFGLADFIDKVNNEDIVGICDDDLNCIKTR